MRRNCVSSIINNTGQGSPIVPDVATGLQPNNEHVEENDYENHCSRTHDESEHVKRTQNYNGSLDGCQMLEEEDGKTEQSLCNDMRQKSCKVQDTHSDTLQASTSDTEGGNMLEINNLKQVVDMGSTSSTLNKEDSHCEHGFPSEDTTLTNQSEPHSGDTVASSTVRRGTEIQFRGLNLEENVSTLRGNRIVLTLECNRCRQRIDQQLSASGYVYYLQVLDVNQAEGLHRAILLNYSVCRE